MEVRVPSIVTACLAPVPNCLSIISIGLTFPALAVLFSRAMNAFQLTGSQLVKEGNFYSLMFLVVAIVNLFFYLIMGWLCNYVCQVSLLSNAT